MKVLVTGAAGKLGVVTCRVLVEAGLDVTGVDSQYHRDLPCRLAVVDLLNGSSLYPHIADCHAVVHLGNHSGMRSATADRIYPENMRMNFNTLHAACQTGVDKLIFASSIQVIRGGSRLPNAPSNLPYLPLDSATPANPDNVYGLSKMHGEQMLRFAVQSHDLRCAIAVRFPSLDTPESLQAHPPRTSHTRTDRPRHYDECFTTLDPEDAARLILAILQTDLPGYRCYLPASPIPRHDQSIPWIIDHYFRDVALPMPVADMTQLVDLSRITQETGWTPTVG